MIQNKEKLISIMRQLDNIVEKSFHAKIIGIFGSYARNEQTDKSDLDVLVRFMDGATMFDLVSLGDFLEEKLGVKIDIVSERALRKELEKSILQEVVLV